MKSFKFANETNSATYGHIEAPEKTNVVRKVGPTLEQLQKSTSPYFIKGTHSCDRANVVGDSDQGRSGEVLFTDSLSLLLAHHVAKAVIKKKIKKFPLINQSQHRPTKLECYLIKIKVTFRAMLFKSSNCSFTK